MQEDKSLFRAGVFFILCYIFPLPMFVLMVYLLTFLVAAPLLLLLKFLQAIGFHYMFLHYGMFGVLGYGLVLVITVYVIGWYIWDFLRN